MRKAMALLLLFMAGTLFAAFMLLGPPQVLARTSTPGFCSSCHVMEAEFEAWLHTGAHRRIACVDCHLPNGNRAEHYLWKSIHGLKDAFAFYSGRVSERIVVSDHSRSIMQANCVRCHESTMAMVATDRDCWSCHRFLQHRTSGAMEVL